MTPCLAATVIVPNKIMVAKNNVFISVGFWGCRVELNVVQFGMTTKHNFIRQLNYS